MIENIKATSLRFIYDEKEGRRGKGGKEAGRWTEWKGTRGSCAALIIYAGSRQISYCSQ